MPEKSVKELGDAYRDAHATEDPEERAYKFEYLKRTEADQSKYYTIPEEHKNSWLEGAMKVGDTGYGTGVPRTAVATALSGLGISDMSMKEATAGIDPTTTQLAPGSGRILESAGVPKMGTYGDIAPTEQTIEDFEKFHNISSYGVAPATLSNTGPLKDVSTRDAIGAALDLGPPTKLLSKMGSVPTAAAKLLDITGAKAVGKGAQMAGKGLSSVAAEFPNAARLAGGPVKVLKGALNKVGEPIKTATNYLKNLTYNYPHADKAAVSAGKGSTNTLAGSWGERPFTDILEEHNVGLTAPNTRKGYEAVKQGYVDEAKELIKRGQTQGMNTYGTPGRSIQDTHILNLSDLTGEARMLATAQAAQRGAPGREGQAALRYLDDLEKEIPLQTYLDDAGQPFQGVTLDEAQKMKQYLQNEQGKSYKLMGSPKTTIMDKIELRLAKNYKEGIENRINRLLPDEVARLKEVNRRAGVLISGEKGFIKDVPEYETRFQRYAPLIPGVAVGGTVLGSTLLNKSNNRNDESSIFPSVAAGLAAAATSSRVGRNMVGLTAKYANKLPLDNAARALYLEGTPNPYDELIRQREKAGMTSRSTFKKQGGK